MHSHFQEQLKSVLTDSLKECYKDLPEVPQVLLDTPADKKFGEFSSNIAMQLTRMVRKPPFEVAGVLVEAVRKRIAQSPLKDTVEKVEVVKPGFINFYLSKQAFGEILAHILKEGEHFGQSDTGKKEKFQIEFVSANPTGPLSVAHARQGAVGDALGNVLQFIGFDVTKEFYVNDEGNQINILGRSIMQRAQEILGEVGRDMLR